MPEQKCPVCSFKTSENAKFCPDCGAPLNKKGQKTAKTKSSSNKDMFIIIGLLFVIVVGYLIVKSPTSPPKPAKQQQQTGSNQNHDHENFEGMEELLANMPVDYNSLVKLGNQTMDAGNYAMAAECYKRALMIDGSSSDVRTDYGACLHGMGLPERALEEFHYVLKNNPNHEIARFNLGIVFYSVGNSDSAKYYWQSYLDKFPNGSLTKAARENIQNIGK